MLLFSFGVYSQTVAIDQLQYTNNGSPSVNVGSCGTIDLASSAYTAVSFDIKLTKPYTETLRNGTAYVYTKKNSTSGKVQKQRIEVQSINWTQGTDEKNPSICTVPAMINVNPSDFDLSGGTLFVGYSEVTENSSCPYDVVRNLRPSLVLYPPSRSIPCNSTTPITFEVRNENNTPGTILYSWKIGAGWNLSAGIYQTSKNTLTLTPVSYPLSNVSATATLVGIDYETGSSIISLAPFSSTATITGISSYCTYPTASTFSINPEVGSTVAWSISNSSVASISSPTNTQVIVTSRAQGVFTLNAVITNSCGQTVIKTKTIRVGPPSVPKIINTSCIYDGAPCALTMTADHNYLSPITLEASFGDYIPSSSDWEWVKISGNFKFFGSNGYVYDTATGTTQHIYLTGPNPTDKSLSFKCRVRNNCGWSQWRTYVWNDGTTTPVPPAGPPSAYFKVTPNPVSSYFSISLLNPSVAPQTSSPKVIKILSQYGQILQNHTSFYGVGYDNYNMSSFANGIYYVNITFDSFSESHTIIKQ